MEKEIYTINKELKILEDQNSLYFNFKKPKSYVRPTYQTLSRYTVKWDYTLKSQKNLEKLLDLNLIVKVGCNNNGGYYVWYALPDVITILIEYAKNYAGQNWDFTYDEITAYIEQLNQIKYDINFSPTQLIKENKQRISYLYKLKEKLC